MIIKISKHENFFLSCLVISLILFFYLKFYELPEISKLKTELSNYNNTKKIVEKFSTSTKNTENMKRNIEDRRALIKGIPEGVATSDIAACISEYTYSLGLKPGTLSIINIGKDSVYDSEEHSNIESQAMNTISMSYSLQGDYDKIIPFIKCIEVCPRRMDITNLSIVKDSNDICTLTLNIKSYCFDG